MKPNKIRNALMAAVVAAMAAACGQDTGAEATANSSATAGQPSALAGSDAALAGRSGLARLPFVNRAPQHSFASLPDGGDLVAYPQERVVRRAGPYTWHRADISEAHALNAIVDGVLTLTAPSGEQLRFQYDRHVEHDSGDWTWIGHVLGGGFAQDAILTFGSSAVFGSIAQPGKAPLKLTIEDGAAWLVETDLALRAAQSAASGRYARPDFLLPPELEIVEGLRTQSGQVRAAEAAAAGTTIDVLIGYTTGYALALGGGKNNPFTVKTRLNFLVDAANESYVNSQVDAEVRLVHVMEVSYQDANDNSIALGALTGSDGTDPVPMDPALEPLHAARDQYGADLVSLVRDFQYPEAVSCGVAWLIGGGQTMVHAGYEGFGMSVVSDGADGGFFCEDSTFAHELGHNMGLAHDVETAKGDDGVLDPEEYGRYAYSFGYKTGVGTGDFYTVMAYGDSGQVGYRVFSNPGVTICGGFACGVEGQADNARTLRQTVPIIASFRDTVVPEGPAGVVRSDFNGDGVSDLLWRHSGDGRNAIWLEVDPGMPRSVTRVPNQDWSIDGVGDFDADKVSDIFWRNSATGQNVIWLSGNSLTPLAVTSAPTPWRLAGVGDFDGDGVSDLLWRKSTSGQNVIWRSANSASDLPMADVANLSWQVAGVGDFDGDRRSDVAWRNLSTGQNTIWLAGNMANPLAVSTVPDQGWQIVAVDDFSGDGLADLVWRHATTGTNAIWLTANSASPRAVARVADPDWKIAGFGDFNGDGISDLFWRNYRTGSNGIWFSADFATSQVVSPVTDTAWRVEP